MSYQPNFETHKEPALRRMRERDPCPPCPHVKRCRDELLACPDYLAFARRGRIPKPTPPEDREPTAEIYEQSNAPGYGPADFDQPMPGAGLDPETVIADALARPLPPRIPKMRVRRISDEQKKRLKPIERPDPFSEKVMAARMDKVIRSNVDDGPFALVPSES